MKNFFIGLSNQKINEANIMKIETKYNVGDSVWIERFNFDKNEYIPYARKIIEIAIYVREKSLNIIYSLDTLYLQRFSEDQLYASKEECQIACDKKNKKEEQ